MKYLIEKLYIYMTKEEVIKQFGIEFAKMPYFSVVYAIPDVGIVMEDNVTPDDPTDIKYATYIRLPNGDYMLDLYYKDLYGGK